MVKKKLVSLMLAGAVTLSLVSPALAVESNIMLIATRDQPWYAESEAYVTEHKLMTGTENGFDPDGIVTRATVFQVLYNLEGSPVTEETDAVSAFTDTQGEWYATCASWAKNTGLAKGTGNNCFEGRRDITRAEAASVFARYASLHSWAVDTAHSKGAEAPDFSDAPAWAAEDILTCWELNIMRGDQDGNLAPNALITRAELAVMLHKYAAKVPAFIEEDVSIPVGAQDGIPAHTIPATLTVPGIVEGKKLPAVVMLHGTGSSRDEAGNGYAFAAPLMAQNDIISLRIDFMGSGESKASYTDYNYASANADAKAAADYLAKLDYVDGNKLAVMGWSQGGTNALLAAKAYPTVFKAVVTWSGALDLTTMFDNFDSARETAEKNGSYKMTFSWREPLYIGAEWFKQVSGTDVLKEIEGLDTPVLAINGDGDRDVPPENAEKIAAAVKNGRFYKVEGADHTYNVFDPKEESNSFPTLSEVVGAEIGFLEETLNGQLSPVHMLSISKYGNVTTDLPLSAFTAAGYTYGDMLKVSAGEREVTLPFGDAYANVDVGNPIALPDKTTGTIALAINMGNFSKIYGIDEKTLFCFSISEKGGYADEYEMRNIDRLRTNDLKDYGDKEDVFANFRNVKMGSIAAGTLYRASSPVNPELGRNVYADALTKKAGIKTIIDLADSEEEYAAYPGVKDTYAGSTDTVKLDMGVDFAAEDFKGKLRTGLLYMADHKAPYLVHCNEGKDRAGYVLMLLECLMGGSYDDIVKDYMLSYVNYYHVEVDSDRYRKIAESNIIANLKTLTGISEEDELKKADLSQAAEKYLIGSIGLSTSELAALKANLAGK